MNQKSPGSLVCVGVGMLLGGHLTPRAHSHIQQADVVFVAVSDPLVELWVQQMHPQVHSLQPLYAQGKSRYQTYREMIETMLAQVRLGQKVCGVFYGHPGVFATVPHQAIAMARKEGFAGLMEPGVSAEDCLYADLGIDPGHVGCQHYEASQFLFYRRRIDPSAYLILWQIGLVGDLRLRQFATGAAHRQLLVDRLTEDYPADHPLIVYEAATLAISAPRIETIALQALPETTLYMHSTLVVPPATPMVPDLAMRARLDELEAQARD